jgi:hypothetical protein
MGWAKSVRGKFVWINGIIIRVSGVRVPPPLPIPLILSIYCIVSKMILRRFFPLHTSYTLFGWFPVAPDYIVFTVIGCVRCLFCVKILC